jgi:hypothetical protein
LAAGAVIPLAAPVGSPTHPPNARPPSTRKGGMSLS